MKIIRLLFVLLMMLLGACTSSPGLDSVDPVEPSATSLDTAVPAIATLEPASGDQEGIGTENSAIPDNTVTFVDLAIHDLAQRLNVEISAIALVSDKAIVWPDATLGCPKPGMDFSPVDIPGHILTLEVARTRYAYHTDDENRVLLCPDEGDRPDEIFIMP